MQLPTTLEEVTAFAATGLPGHLGIEFTEFDRNRVIARMPVVRSLMAPHGFLHAGSVISLADSVCGIATYINLPEGADNFTTIELKSNHLGTAREGAIYAVAEPVHLGRSTQVWDAKVMIEGSDKVIALFRNTQMILYPKK